MRLPSIGSNPHTFLGTLLAPPVSAITQRPTSPDCVKKGMTVPTSFLSRRPNSTYSPTRIFPTFTPSLIRSIRIGIFRWFLDGEWSDLSGVGGGLAILQPAGMILL